MNNEIKQSKIQILANNICDKLISRGIIIHRFDNINKETTIMKFDYGVACMLTIKNTIEQKSAYTRFNLVLDINEYKRDYYNPNAKSPSIIDCYPIAELDLLIEDIIDMRQDKLQVMSKDNYMRRMQEVISFDVKTSRPNYFWKNAYLIDSCSEFIHDWNLNI